MKSVSVLGLGYIGLPTAAILAVNGHRVVGIDVNERVIATLRSGAIHIQEPGLHTLVQGALQAGTLSVSAQLAPSDVFIIAVPTPLVGEHHVAAPGGMKRADLAFVRAAAETVAQQLQPGNLVVLESTSPPGTTSSVVVPALEHTGLKAGRDFSVAHCPERVLPSRILEELVANDRVIGGIDAASAEMARDLYRSFVAGQIFCTDATTAEMVKLMENTYRDVNIALANELALVAEGHSIDVRAAIAMANRHPRVNIHQPGPGVGGHCIAVDPWFIAQAAPALTSLIQTARRVNDQMPSHVVELVRRATHGLDSPIVACLGLAYKADVDDARESPAIEVVHGLRSAGFSVRAYDPYIAAGVIPEQVASLDAAINGAEIIVLLTDHTEFCSLLPRDVTGFHGRVVIDTRAALPPALWAGSKVAVWQLGNGCSFNSQAK